MLGLRLKRATQPFVASARPYWDSDDKWQARSLLAILVVLLLGNTAFNVLLNEQAGEFTSALAAQESERYWFSIYKSACLFAAAAPFYVFYYFVRDKLANYWRRWLTHNFLDTYFRNNAFYKLAFNTEVDNPDQRISEDINTFTLRSIYYLLLLVETVLQLVAFSGVLWSISRTLVLFLVIYATIGTLITSIVFGRSLVALNFLQLRTEADFRFSLIRVRENAESIAFYRGEVPEAINIKRKFADLYINYNKIINWQWFLNLFQYSFSSVTLILPGIVLAPKVLSGEIEVGRVVQAAGAFAAIFSALTIIVNNFDTLSRFAAGVSRLVKFANSLESSALSRDPGRTRIATQGGSCLALNNLSLQTPDYKRTLIVDLSIEVHSNEGLLIAGVSGGGKSSLLRAIAGLWDSGNGTIIRPPLREIFFLPQRPYMVIGTLRDQLQYPGDKKSTDEEIRSVLHAVNLSELPERFGGLDMEADWDKILSLGEQQRVAFARVLIAEPRFVILDEATSALDLKNEDMLYQLLLDSGATLISVSHRQNVVKFHSHILTLLGDGRWQLSLAKDMDGLDQRK